MKKTNLSLAALILMAAPIVSSCNKELREVAPVEKNVVTITIAAPVADETRVETDGDFKITGWTLEDEVVLYKTAGRDAETLGIEGEGVSFKCTDAAEGTFTGELESGDKLDDYNLAAFGATVTVDQTIGGYCLVPETISSASLKDVVMMAAWNEGNNTYTMKVVNNVMRITNGGSSDVEVAWCAGDEFFAPLSVWQADGKKWAGAAVASYPDKYVGWNAGHFTLAAGEESFVNMGICGDTAEEWGLANENGKAFLEAKSMAGRADVMGKIYNAGTVTPAPLTLDKVLYYDNFNAQANNTPDLCDDYVKDMHGAGVAEATYTAGPLVDFRNTYNQSHDGGTYNDYVNELWPNKTSEYDHSGGRIGDGKPMHLYPCVTPGTGQTIEDAWFQINDIKLCGSTAIQLGFAAFGVDGPSQVDYTFKYKFDNQSDWTVYKAFRVEQYWQWVSLDQLTVPSGATSVSFRGEAQAKNYIRFDDITLVGDEDGGYVEPIFELVSPSTVELDANAQDVNVEFKTNIDFTHNLADYSSWITPKNIKTEGENVTVTLGIAANNGAEREAEIVVENKEKGKEIKLTIKQKASGYLELIGKAIEDDAFSVGREGADIVAKFRTNVTPSVEGLPSWATIKNQKTSGDEVTVTIAVAPNTTAQVRSAVVRVYNSSVADDILYYISQDCTLPSGSNVLFAENFDWMKEYFQEYEDANSGTKIGDTVGKRDKDANSPNFYSAKGLDGLRAAFSAKGYGDSNAGKKVIYPNDAYLKFGKTSTGTRLVLPALDVDGTVDATITFNYAFQIQGSGKMDATELFVFVDGTKVNAEKLPTTQTGGSATDDPRIVRDFTWQTVTLDLEGISRTSKIEIGNEIFTATQRFFLDNIVISRK